MLAWDTETALIREGCLAPPLACITFSDGERVEIVHHADRGAKRCARWLLEQETTTANAPYDLAVIWAYFPDLQDLVWDAITQGRVHDVITRQKLMDLGQGRYRRYYKKMGRGKPRKLNYSLSDLNARYFDSFLEKDTWRLKYGELRNYPLAQWPQGAVDYAMLDALVTSRVHTMQDQAAYSNPKHNLWDEANQVRAHWALHLMSCWGFATDAKQVRKLLDNIDKEMPELAAQMLLHNLTYKNKKGELTRSTSRAKKLMYTSVGEAAELTKTGYEKVKNKEMTKAEALRKGYIKVDEEWCEISNHPGLIAYFKYGQNLRLKAKLGHVLRAAEHNFPVQTSFEVLMETGRTSSSENRLLRNSMALQNPERKGGFRECFIARPGYTLIAADYGQAELVSLAQVTYSLFGESQMRNILNSGRDIHLTFGLKVLEQQRGIQFSYEQGEQLLKNKDKIIKDMRQMSKAADFGFPGGLGAASFQSYARKVWGVTLTLDQAYRLKQQWLEFFPEMDLYFTYLGLLVEEKGLADIQHLVSNRWRGGCFYTQGCNSLFQGLTADAAKAAAFEVARHCYTVKSSPLYGCHPILFVHDEILTEAPRAQAAEAAREQERIMVEVYQRYTPDVRITADAHLMDCWSKDAEAIFDERGKLIPWVAPEEVLAEMQRAA